MSMAMNWFEEAYEAGEEEAREQAADDEYTGELPDDLVDRDGGVFGTPAPSEETAEEVAEVADPGGATSGTVNTGNESRTMLVGLLVAVIVLIGVMKWADS